MDFSHVTQKQRETLYNEVWTEPVTIVAKRYNISDNGLRKHCKRLWIPLPPSGYWAKVKAGKKVLKIELPKVRGELKKYVRNYVIKYREDIDQLTDDDLKVDKELSLLTEETKKFIYETCSQVKVKDQLRNPHDLITQHKEEALYRKKRDKTLLQASFNTDYYKITKSKYRENMAMLPLNVSDSNINRTYRILDTLIDTIEDMEGFISVNLESGKDVAYFVIMCTIVYFEFKEEGRKKSISSDNTEVVPILVLSMIARNWFGGETQYKLEYKDSNKDPLESKLGLIIHDMFVIANKILVEEKLSERELNKRIEEHDRQRRLEQMRNGELEEVKLLEQAVSDWDKAQKIRMFTDCMEKVLNEVTDEVKREKIIKWIDWSRNKADWLDPLIAKSDDLLGMNVHIFDRIINEEHMKS
jgi:hypothetical protein